MKIALLSPKGPLYPHSGGIFKKSLRYQPLTLTTLAALAPPELDVEFALYDEGIGDVPLDLDADLIGMTVITGSSPRAYELAAHFRARGIPVVLGGPHVTLLPDEAQQHADAICVGYAEETWPQLLRDFAAGRMRPRYDQGHDFELTNLPFPRRDLLDERHFLTQAVFEATRACAHDCEFCVVADRLGPQAVPEAGRPCGRGHPARRRAPHHLHRSQPHLGPRLCGASCSRRWCRSASAGSASPPA